MSYRKELQQLVNELREKSNAAGDADAREKFRRQAEVLDFFVNHTQDAIANLDAE